MIWDHITPEHSAELDRIGARRDRIFEGEWGWKIQLQRADIWIDYSTASGKWICTDSGNEARVFASSPAEAYAEYLRARSRGLAAEIAWSNACAAEASAELARIGAEVAP